jgi:hypothetical protein
MTKVAVTLVGSVVVGAEFGKENYGSIPYNYI